MADRSALLETTLKQRLIDTQTHLEALERAVATFPAGFERSAFEQAWTGDAAGRLTAYPIQAGYENTVNGCVKIAQELCELNGWTPANREPSSAEALLRLKENGIIGARTHAALKAAYERRSDIQHDYVRVGARQVFDATLEVIEQAPNLLQDVALHLRHRG